MEFGETEPISGDGFWFVKDVGLKGYKGFLVFLRELIQNGYDAFLSRSEEYRSQNPLKYMIFHDKINKLIIFRNNGAPLSELDIQRLKKPGKYALEGNNNRIGEHNSGILTGFRLTNQILFRSGSRILSLGLDWDKRMYFAQLSEKTNYFLDGTEVWISYRDKLDPLHKWYLNYPIEKQDLDQLNAISDYLADENNPIFLFLNCFKECTIIEREEMNIRYISMTRNQNPMTEPPFDSSKEMKVSVVEISKYTRSKIDRQSKLAKLIDEFSRKHTLHEKIEDAPSLFQNQEIINLLNELKVQKANERANLNFSQDSIKYLLISSQLSRAISENWPYFAQLKKKGVDLQKIFLENRFSQNPEIEIAFFLSNDGFLKPIQGKIFVFLPSSLDIGLHFHLNGRFKSSTSRESLVFEGLDGIYNKYMIEEASKLTAKSLELLRLSLLQTIYSRKNQKLGKNSSFSHIDLSNPEYIDRWYEIIIPDIQKIDIKFAHLYEICDKEVSNHFFTQSLEVQPLSNILFQPPIVEKELAENFKLLLDVAQTAYQGNKFISYNIKSQKIHNKLSRPLSRSGFGISYLSFSTVFQIINSKELSAKLDLSWWKNAITLAIRYISFESQPINYKMLYFPNNLENIVQISQLMLLDCEFPFLKSLLFWIPEENNPNLSILDSQQNYWGFLLNLLKKSGITILSSEYLLKLIETRLVPIENTEDQEKKKILHEYISTLQYFSKLDFELKERPERIIITKNEIISPLEARNKLIIVDSKEFKELKETLPDFFSELIPELAENPLLKPVFIRMGIHYSITNEFLFAFYKILMLYSVKIPSEHFISIFLKTAQFFSKYTFNVSILKQIGMNIVIPYNKTMVPIENFTIFNPDAITFGPSILQTFFNELKQPILFVDGMETYQFLVNLGGKKIPEPEFYADLIEKATVANHIEVRKTLFMNAAEQSAEWKKRLVELLKIKFLFPINDPTQFKYVLELNDLNNRIFGDNFGAFPIIDRRFIENLQIECRKFAVMKDVLEIWRPIKEKYNLDSENLPNYTEILKQISVLLDYIEKGYRAKEYTQEDLNVVKNEHLILLFDKNENEFSMNLTWCPLDGLIYDDLLGIHRLIFGKNEKFFGKSLGYSQEWYSFFESIDGIKTITIENIVELFEQMEMIYEKEKKIDPDKYNGIYIYLSLIFGQLPDNLKNTFKKKKCVVAFEFDPNMETNYNQQKAGQSSNVKNILLKKPTEVYFIDEPMVASKFAEKGKKIHVPVKFDFKSDSFLEKIGIRKISEVIHKSLLKTEIQGNQRFFSEDKMKSILLSIQPIILSLVQHKLGSDIADQMFEDFKNIKIMPCQSLAINYTFDGSVINIQKDLILNLPNLYFTQTLISKIERGELTDLIDESALLIANNQPKDAPFIHDLLHNALNHKNPLLYLKSRGIRTIDTSPLNSGQKGFEIIWNFRTKSNSIINKNQDLMQILKRRKSIESEYQRLPVRIDDSIIRDFLNEKRILIRGRESQIEVEESVPDLDLIQISLNETGVYIPNGLSDSEIEAIKKEFSDLKEIRKFIEVMQKVVEYMGFKMIQVNPVILFEPIAAFYSENLLCLNLFYAGKGNLLQRLKNEQKYLISWLILLSHEMAHSFEKNHSLLWQKRFEQLVIFVIEKFDEIRKIILI